MKRTYIVTIESRERKTSWMQLIDQNPNIQSEIADMVCDDLEQTSLSSEKKAKRQRRDKIFEKYVIPYIFVGYIILFSTSFLGNENVRYVTSIFMSLFSLALAIFYSRKIQETNIYKKFEKYSHTMIIMGFFLLSLLCTYIVWTVLLEAALLKGCSYLQENIGNILTWLSIVTFFIDKSYEIKNTAYESTKQES